MSLGLCSLSQELTSCGHGLDCVGKLRAHSELPDLAAVRPVAAVVNSAHPQLPFLRMREVLLRTEVSSLSPSSLPLGGPSPHRAAQGQGGGRTRDPDALPQPTDTGCANHRDLKNLPPYHKARVGDTPQLQECWQDASPAPLPWERG
jgi:hypothetical protein